MSGANAEAARPLDKRPFLWMLGILAGTAVVVLGFRYAGEQKKLHNRCSGSASTR